MTLHYRLPSLAAVILSGSALGACVQILGDDFAVDEAATATTTATESGGSSAGGSTTSSQGGSGASTQGGAGGGTATGGGTGGQGGSEPPCGAPGEICCETGPECDVLSCLNGTCPEITPLVQVDKPDPYVGSYGIDRTEVTRKQYAQWLATNPIVATLIGTGCGGKSSFAPDPTCMGHAFVCSENCDNHPQVCVDWCDAHAYCTAVGKKLCAHVEPGYNSFDLEPATNAWSNACTAGGVNDYSPGDSDGDCYVGGYGNTAEVGTIATCQSTVEGYTGIYDLTGNVQEWINVCDGNTAADSCIAAGGSFADDSPYTMCIYPQYWGRLDHRYVVGFRCCEL